MTAIDKYAKVTNAAQDKIKDVTTRCKKRLYDEAMEALVEANKKKAGATEASAAAKKKYDEGANRGKSCAKGADGARADLCEGENTCCGQANRYDRDGTRRSIEVCGSPDQTSYTYWPEFKTGMMKEPKSEEWRYYCLAGAGSLAASATALATAIFFAQ